MTKKTCADCRLTFMAERSDFIYCEPCNEARKGTYSNLLSPAIVPTADGIIATAKAISEGFPRYTAKTYSTRKPLLPSWPQDAFCKKDHGFCGLLEGHLSPCISPSETAMEMNIKMAFEFWYAALIRSRKVQPEPKKETWRPSVDDFDLLPDA